MILAINSGMWVVLQPGLLHLGTPPDSGRFVLYVSGCVSPSAEEQAAHLSDILVGVPTVKIEQKWCGINQNSQRRVLALLAAGKEFVAFIEEGICFIGEDVLEVLGIFFGA
jgi:hypothetical protein